MLIGIVKVDNLEHATQQIIEANQLVDAFELRLDFYDGNITTLAAWRQTLKKPIILTLRARRDGGIDNHHNNDRIKKLIQLANILHPQYIDIEHHTRPTIIKEIKQLLPATKIIYSYHNLNETPHNLQSLLDQMIHPLIDTYKIVPKANSTEDALRLLSFLNQNKNQQIIAHSLGEHGQFTRVLCMALGSNACYINTRENILSHGLQLADIQLYQLNQVNHKTKCYALLGDPIKNSPGHLFHNNEFTKKNKNAVYVKISINKQNLNACWPYLCELNFCGFSITIPLKQSFSSLLSSELQCAINTLNMKPSIESTNTDGLGALAALERQTKIDGKRILLLGSGGTAHAIAEILAKKQVNLIICNRNQDKAKLLARKHHGTPISINNLNETIQPDVIISTLPPAAYTDGKLIEKITPLLIRKKPTVMDVVYYPIITPLLRAAKKNKCQLIYGKDMFEQQALLQQQFWNKEKQTNKEKRNE